MSTSAFHCFARVATTGIAAWLFGTAAGSGAGVQGPTGTSPLAGGSFSKPPAPSPAPIDRRAVLARHNVVLSKPDPLSPLQVGNGRFAFNMDVTGLQTLYGNTLSDWCWHESPLPAGMKPEDRLRTEFVSHGRKRYYLAPAPLEQKQLVQWLYDNPHRVNLGRLRFVLPSGQAVNSNDLANVRQRLDLWTGLVTSEFEISGHSVQVETCCHPEHDLVAVKIQSSLLSNAGLEVALDFSYPEHSFRWGPNLAQEPWLGNWKAPQKHQTLVSGHTERRIDLEREADDMKYCVGLAWTGEFSVRGPGAGETSRRLPAHSVNLINAHTNVVELVCAYAQDPLPKLLPSFEETKAASARQMRAYWESGGAIDLSGSHDARWRELERRVVLSQYLMRVNSTGKAPPQECGLLSDSWCGKFHLEMTAWHGAHFMFWGRPECVHGWMDWMRQIGLPSAVREAHSEGWAGAKWLKTPDPLGRWESWDHGPNRVTQNVHPLFWAELSYRARPNRQTLEQWKEIVFETAQFLADFVAWDEKTQRYILGPPVMSGAEAASGFEDWNPTSELNYWAYGLNIAQLWRERLGLPREQNWDHILQHFSRPPVSQGVYIDAESAPDRWSQEPSSGKWIRPAWFEVYGCIAGPLIDPSIMEKTYQRAARELREDLWKGNLWGCDYPMMAMTAARLGKPREAVEWLLHPSPLNQYAPNGFCSGYSSFPSGWYLPGNGGLLWAVAMMTAGWDGAPSTHAPGFPDTGEWIVRCEGLKPSP